MIPPKTRSVLTIGNFDGIHLGHQKLLRELLSIAHSKRLQSVVITYDHHPKYTLNGENSIRLLTPESHKPYLLEQHGIDRIVLLEFNQQLAHQSAFSFLGDQIVARLSPVFIVTGFDSHFGYHREGTHEFLMKYQDEYDYTVIHVTPELYQDTPVSSSMIRQMLISGDLITANTLLGKPYRLCGKVVKSHGLGRSLGFPTANLDLLDTNQLVPKTGVYISRVFIKGQCFFGLTNIGYSPTLKIQDKMEIETYIMDFSDQIYGEHMALDLIEYIRPEIRFESEAELGKAMLLDLNIARERIEHVSLD
ncbi:MAG: bifunctional riboflavin kinase/FAD synthetase [Candidatus Cloacimonetes bacterium]|nr:bifunctional riboflavin kinase/FAD synthetase [Candidatus Cloacimonadota bacterium]